MRAVWGRGYGWYGYWYAAYGFLEAQWSGCRIASHGGKSGGDVGRDEGMACTCTAGQEGSIHVVVACIDLKALRKLEKQLQKDKAYQKSS